jgi:FixJ family two-component response regulator
MVDHRRSSLVAVVEDDPSCRTALGRLLRAEGFEPALFESAEAYMNAPPETPLCVIVDVHLPGISGIELQQRLCDTGHAPPIIVTTGTREGVIRERAERNGCAGFFWKPFDGSALLSMLAVIADDTRTS